jgi:UPF0755 protein
MTDETTDQGAPAAASARGQQARPIVPKTASEALRPQAGTPPPVRSRRSKNQVVVFLNFLMSTVVLLAIAAFAAVWYGKATFEGPGPLAVSDTVLVRPNTGVSEIAEALERRGMISDARIFRIGLRVHGNDGRLRAGEYEVKAGASMHQIMDLLVSGRSILHSLTVPEGLTVAQVFRRIAAAEELDGDMPAEMPPEGALAADTIRFTCRSPTSTSSSRWPRSSRRRPAAPMNARASLPSSSTGCARACACNPTPPSSTASSAGRANRPTGRSTVPTSTRRRPTTPIRSTACRPARSLFPAAPRSRPSPTRR